MVTAAGIYARISLDRSGQELGVGRQVDDCTALAQRLGWPVAGRYIDNDVSAFRAKRRPEYQRLLDDLKGGRLDAVLVYHPDRLTRRPVELEELIEVLEAAQAPVATVAAGDYDLGTASGRMVARILGSIARGEAERMGERVARKKLELAEAGRPPGGGMRPYGYEPGGMVVRPAEAEVLRVVAADILAGVSYRQAAARLNAEGYLRDGRPWHPTGLRRVLTAPRWAGLRTYRGVVVGPAAWPAILDMATHEALVALSEVRKRVPTSRTPYLLRGLVTCGVCGTRLFRVANRGTVAYHCSTHHGCGRVSIAQAKLDGYVLGHIEKILADPVALRGISARLVGGDDLAELEDQIAAVETELATLARMHGADELETVEWAALRGPLRDRLTALRGQRAALPMRGKSVDLEALVAAWGVTNVAGRNGLLHEIGLQVVVDPVGRGGRMVPVADRVRISP